MRWMLPHHLFVGGARCSWMSFGDLVFGEVGQKMFVCFCFFFVCVC